MIQRRIRTALALTALACGPVAAALALEEGLAGTWVLERVERRDSKDHWTVVEPSPRIGMLIYGIVGPMRAGPGDGNPAGAPAPAASAAETPGVVVMYIDDGRMRLVWARGREVR